MDFDGIYSGIKPSGYAKKIVENFDENHFNPKKQ
jgi:hypothetical protein